LDVQQFVRFLKVFTAIAICVAMGDVLTGHWIARDLVAVMPSPDELLADDPSSGDGVRAGLRRAISTFDHPILYGIFCSMTAAIVLYSTANGVKRWCWAGFCFFGGLLSLSSAAVMAIAIVVSGYAYDRLTRRILLWTGVAVFLTIVIAVTNNPLSWLLSHVTIDPTTGFYRLLIWDAVSAQVWQAPLTGAGFVTFGYYLLDRTVDSVWLVTSLHYGLPVTFLLIALNFSAWLRVPGRPSLNVQRGFTVVCVVFLLTGLTVHFWNYMWTFWGVCIGVRASLREWQMLGARDEQC
jgi:O-antigen ligase